MSNLPPENLNVNANINLVAIANSAQPDIPDRGQSRKVVAGLTATTRNE